MKRLKSANKVDNRLLKRGEHNLDFILFKKGHSFCKQFLHDLQFMKTGSSSPNFFKLARADISRSAFSVYENKDTIYKTNGL